MFKEGAQRNFVVSVLQHSRLSVDQIAKRLSVSGRTVRDWRREKHNMSLASARELAKIGGAKIPADVTIYDRREQLRNAGILGGRALFKKYGRVGGDKEKRKEAWQRWWLEKGKLLPSKILYQRKAIKYPARSVKLAEFVGILMGDGGISRRQVTVTLHSETDREFARYYSNLCESLFGVCPSITKIKNCKAVNVTISRTDLVQWCHKLGLPIGHKIRQGLDIPDWIKKSPEYSRACLRGLVDTDGSVFTHTYRVAGKEYRYKKIDFCTLSRSLLQSAYVIFRANGMKPYVAQGKKLRLESENDVSQYFKVIGSSNPKHLRRYRK